MNRFDWLLKFGFAGVQDYVSRAGKMRDLANGSGIVAWLSETIGNRPADSKAELILPAVDDHVTTTWPHQLVWRLNKCCAEDVDKFGNDLVQAVRRSWEKEATSLNERLYSRPDSIRGEAPKNLALALEREAAERRVTRVDVLREQTSDFLELYWVAVQISDDGKPAYRNAYEKLCTEFDYRKHTRTFEQVTELHRIDNRACSLCGLRPAILQPPKHGWTDHFFRRPHEALCFSCAVRRAWRPGRETSTRRRFAFAADLDQIPSTHGLARDRVFRSPIFEGLRAEFRARDLATGHARSLLNDLDELVRLRQSDNALDKARYDSFAPKAVREVFEHVFFPEDSAKRDSRAQWLRQLQRLSYYAVLVFDGDSMGRWFSGDFWPHEESLCENQQKLSKALLGFASMLPGLHPLGVDHPPLLVYTGGDDGLMFCATDALLPLIREIRKAWEQVERGCPPGTDLKGIVKRPTLSLHASVIHAKQPLQPVMREARGLLESAKDCANRDCFSVLARPHSGAAARMIERWDRLADFEQAVRAFVKGAVQLANGQRLIESLPLRLLHGINESVFPFFDASGQIADSKSLRSELDRLFRRSPEAEHSDRIWEKVRRWLEWRASGKDQCGTTDWEAFSAAVHVTAFLARVLSEDQDA